MPAVFLKAIDGATIFADRLPVEGSTNVALLLHQRGKDHAMWDGLRKALRNKGWSTLAIDLRGHGKSDEFGKNHDLKYDQVDDYHSMMFDVSAATDFIRNEFSALSAKSPDSQIKSSKEIVDPRQGRDYKLALIGSSIGANLALAYAADHFAVKAAVLLSPGLNYFGLRTDDVMVQYHRPLALLTAKDDPSYADVQKLIKLPGTQRPNLWYQEFETGGHGVALLEAHSEMIEKIAEWLEKSCNA